MEHKDIYKFNPRLQDYKDQRREDLVERRKSRRNDCFHQRRNLSEDSDVKETEQPVISKGKENRRDLLKKWKDEHRKETSKNTKKPFVVGVVRHNAGSPLFKAVPPLREMRQVARLQVTRPQAPTPQTSGTSGVYCFGRQKPAVHKFTSVKKLTVPITPSFMDPAKRGNLSSKAKPEASAGSSKSKATNPVKPPVTEKRVTRATTAASKDRNKGSGKGAIKKSPMKKVVTRKVNVPAASTKNQAASSSTAAASTARAGPSRKREELLNQKPAVQCETSQSSEVRRIIEDFVLSPMVRTNREPLVPLMASITFKEKPEPELPQAPEEMETETQASATNAAHPAQEFYDRLQRETDLLLECCDRWSGPAFTQTTPQDVSDEIDSTVGQARLLVSDKFQQFKRLIENFEEGSQPPVTSEDLNGFWDMINIQVDKMKERFNQLSELKNNNWAKKTSEVVVKKKVVVKPKTAKPVSKSRFQDFLAKKKLGNNSKESCESKNNASVEENQPKIGTPLKDRVMQQILDTSRSERRRSSLATANQVLRTSLIGKTIAMSPLLKTGEKSAIGARKSILQDNCPSPLATSTGTPRKKVDFGVENPTDSLDSPVVRRIPQTPKPDPTFNVLTDDDSDDETVTNDNDVDSTVSKRIPQTPRFVLSSVCISDDESDATLLAPRTPRFENKCFTDDESDTTQNTNRRRSSRLGNQTPNESISHSPMRSSRRLTNQRQTINESTGSHLDTSTATGGRKKKVGFGAVQPIQSIDTPTAIGDNSSTTSASLSFESPQPRQARRSARIRQNTPYASRN